MDNEHKNEYKKPILKIINGLNKIKINIVIIKILILDI